jgi:hypothetical protein
MIDLQGVGAVTFGDLIQFLSENLSNCFEI